MLTLAPRHQLALDDVEHGVAGYLLFSSAC